MKEFLKKLVKENTTAPNGEIAVANLISAEFAQIDIKAEVDQWSQNRANVFARIKSNGQKKPILFVSHLDVVGPGQQKWQQDPFSGDEKDGKIYGRGSCDMKGGIAASLFAIKQIIEQGTELQGDIIFLATAGEETDSCGTKRFIEKNAEHLSDLAGVIVPEPTDFQIITQHRGLLWLEITTKGKTAHGSTPWLGVNAIALMQKVLNELENYQKQKNPADCTMSINKIIAGDAFNVVPDACKIGIDIRTAAANENQIITEDLKKIFEKIKSDEPKFNADISIFRDVPALQQDNNCKFIKDFCQAAEISETKTVGYCTDAPFFAALDLPAIVFGPGKTELCHKPDEYIEIKDLEKAADVGL